jgi:hypothetical protein
MDDTPVKGAPNSHTTIFNPIGKYATDIQTANQNSNSLRSNRKEKTQEDLNIFTHNVLNLVKNRATEVPITQIVHLANVSLSLIKTRNFHPTVVTRKDS